LLVVGALLVVTSFARTAKKLEVAAVQSSGSPSASRPQPSSKPDADVAGAAPWALSALPDCFEQLSETRGSPAYAEARLPPGGTLAPPQSVLRAADCSVTVGARDLLVRRGDLRLVVPPDVRLYVWPDRFAVLRRDGTQADLRVYSGAHGVPLVLEASGRNGR
jgi:hypothetical protein